MSKKQAGESTLTTSGHMSMRFTRRLSISCTRSTRKWSRASTRQSIITDKPSFTVFKMDSSRIRAVPIQPASSMESSTSGVSTISCSSSSMSMQISIRKKFSLWKISSQASSRNAQFKTQCRELFSWTHWSLALICCQMNTDRNWAGAEFSFVCSICGASWVESQSSPTS